MLQGAKEGRNLVFPEALRKGDKIAIVSPASCVKEEFVAGAVVRLLERGYNPVVMPHATNCVDGSYAAPLQDRLQDITEAILDKDVKAILCARGGYGCVHLLSGLPAEMIALNPKWIIGFSDVSALHALWLTAGVASIHGPMAKHLATEPADDLYTEALFNILESGGEFDYTVSSLRHTGEGSWRGILRGGNLAVLNGLAGTPYDTLNVKDNEDVILFFEDISEPIYAVERMLMRLYYTGSLQRAKGLIFGQFTDYKPDRNHENMEEMIFKLLSRLGIIDRIPVVSGFPTGHVKENYPVTEGARVELEIGPGNVRLRSVPN